MDYEDGYWLDKDKDKQSYQEYPDNLDMANKNSMLHQTLVNFKIPSFQPGIYAQMLYSTNPQFLQTQPVKHLPKPVVMHTHTKSDFTYVHPSPTSYM